MPYNFFKLYNFQYIRLVKFVHKTYQIAPLYKKTNFVCAPITIVTREIYVISVNGCYLLYIYIYNLDIVFDINDSVPGY